MEAVFAKGGCDAIWEAICEYDEPLKKMLYPPRTTMLRDCVGLQAKPKRGERLLLSGRTRLAGSAPEYGPATPGVTTDTAVKSGLTSRFARCPCSSV